jgi:hypothetical protein
MRAITLARLPIFACAGFLLFLFLANLWNFAVERDWPKLRIRSASPLAGVAKPKPATWTPDAFLSGQLQRSVSTNIGRLSPVFPISVRAKNQLVFSLLGQSPSPDILIGQRDQLYERLYVLEFCARGAPPDLAHADGWAASIRQIQDALAKRGKGFIYVISPSKAARYSEDLPLSVPCAAHALDMPDKIAPYREALEAHGVRFVDGATLISKKRADYPLPLFPRGGTHWNMLAAGLAFQEMIRTAPWAVGDMTFSWSLAPEAVGTDRDLAELMNLLWTDYAYPTPAVVSTTQRGACPRPPRLLALGGSFVHELLVAATLAACPPEVENWFFMRTEDNGIELGHYHRPPGETGNGERQSAALPILDENLRNADFVLLEENETGVSHSQQTGVLADALARRE